MTKNINSPIFIHSLWRTGSTYIFKVFRRAKDIKYYCYQEPIHEMALNARELPEKLLNTTSSSSGELLNHPFLDKPYFQELFDVHRYWKDKISKEIIYDQYFFEECTKELKNYLLPLITYAKGIPVVQECRTSCRLRGIKEEFKGIHIYLWRNSWDQWWSLKKTPYFDVVLLLILNAKKYPPIIEKVKEIINFQNFHNDNINLEHAFFDKKRLMPHDNYFVFYTLWCLSLLEGLASSDVMLNIDKLSESKEYRFTILNELRSKGVDGIDFSDCKIMQRVFTSKNIDFFIAIENKVYELLKEYGYSVDKIIFQRKKFQPVHYFLSNTNHLNALNDTINNLTNIIIDKEIMYLQKLNHTNNRLASIEKENIFKNNQMQKIKNLFLVNNIDEILIYDGSLFILYAYVNILNRFPDEIGLKHFLNALSINTLTKGDIIYKLLHSSERKKMTINNNTKRRK